MRLDQITRDGIIAGIGQLPAGSRLYLYGSRVSDDLKGGDIDLLIVGEKALKRRRFEVLAQIQTHIGEQRIDLKWVDSTEFASSAFIQGIKDQLVLLKEW